MIEKREITSLAEIKATEDWKLVYDKNSTEIEKN